MSRKLGELLLARQLITPADLEEALRSQFSEGHRLGSLLVAQGRLRLDVLSELLHAQLGIRVVTPLELADGASRVRGLLTPEQIQRFSALPIRVESGLAHVALCSPQDLGLVAALQAELGATVVPYLMPQVLLVEAASRLYALELAGPRAAKPVPATEPQTDLTAQRAALFGAPGAHAREPEPAIPPPTIVPPPAPLFTAPNPAPPVLTPVAIPAAPPAIGNLPPRVPNTGIPVLTPPGVIPTAAFRAALPPLPAARPPLLTPSGGIPVAPGVALPPLPVLQTRSSLPAAPPAAVAEAASTPAFALSSAPPALNTVKAPTAVPAPTTRSTLSAAPPVAPARPGGDEDWTRGSGLAALLTPAPIQPARAPSPPTPEAPPPAAAVAPEPEVEPELEVELDEPIAEEISASAGAAATATTPPELPPAAPLENAAAEPLNPERDPDTGEFRIDVDADEVPTEPEQAIEVVALSASADAGSAEVQIDLEAEPAPAAEITSPAESVLPRPEETFISALEMALQAAAEEHEDVPTHPSVELPPVPVVEAPPAIEVKPSEVAVPVAEASPAIESKTQEVPTPSEPAAAPTTEAKPSEVVAPPPAAVSARPGPSALELPDEPEQPLELLLPAADLAGHATAAESTGGLRLASEGMREFEFEGSAESSADLVADVANATAISPAFADPGDSLSMLGQFVDDAARQLIEVRDVEGLLKVLAVFLDAVAERGAVLEKREGMLVPVCITGASVEPGDAALSVPLDATSSFRACLEAGKPWRGELNEPAEWGFASRLGPTTRGVIIPIGGTTSRWLAWGVIPELLTPTEAEHAQFDRFATLASEAASRLGTAS